MWYYFCDAKNGWLACSATAAEVWRRYTAVRYVAGGTRKSIPAAAELREPAAAELAAAAEPAELAAA